ncbi:hypothetical protein LTR86_011127 [Recurvomyces mirabilis]|nr:hypothetical protein LTR86_011127 [Recurvomyces mirabilis]
MSSTSRKRKRARVACIPCHQRKRKCDGDHPCSLCTNYDYECRYADNTRSRDVAIGHSTVPSLEDHGTVPNTGAEAPAPVPINSGVDLADVQVARETDSTDATTTAFPHILSQTLDGDKALDMEPLANNFGIQAEEASYTHASLEAIISEASLNYYSAIYFPTMGMIGDFVDHQIYALRCQALYHHTGRRQIMFGAVAAGIAALGSFLSPEKFAQESGLVQYAKAILEDPVFMNKLDIDHLIAWALRVLYLRATTRPMHAWMASCTLMHLCEAVGLHNDHTIKKMALRSDLATHGHSADMLRRIFWIAWAGNNLMSYEYDRSPVVFRTVTTQAVMATNDSLADEFVRIAQITPSSNSPFQLEHKSCSPQEDFTERMKALENLHVADPFLLVTKADLALCFYRRLHLLKTGIPDECFRITISIGNAAVQAAEQLAKQGLFFWNVIGSVFQYACVLLAMKASVSSAHVASTLRCLDYMAEVSNTKATRDVRAMVRRLLDLSVAKKRKELSRLESVQTLDHSAQTDFNVSAPSSTPDFDEDFDWGQLFHEPSMFDWLGSDLQLIPKVEEMNLQI